MATRHRTSPLPSQSGEPVRLSDRLGQRVVVLYFCPKDDTRGCTALEVVRQLQAEQPT